MYKDLAEAIEDAIEQGFKKVFEIGEQGLTAEGINEPLGPDRVKIVESYHFDQGTSAGDDRSLFLLETDNGDRGYLATGYTTFRNREKAEFLDRLTGKRR